MADTPIPRGSISTILPNVAKDLDSIRIGFVKLATLKRQDGVTSSFAKSKIRQNAYKEKFTKVKIDKFDDSKKTIVDHAKDFASILGSIGGALGSAFLLLGAAGIAKMLLSSDAGSYISKFISNIFTSLVDLIKTTLSFLQELIRDEEVKSAIVGAISSVFRFIGDLFVKGFEMAKTLLSDSEVISSINKIIKSLFTTIYEAFTASLTVVTDLFVQNSELIKKGVVDLFTKIVNVLVPLLEIGGSAFKDLVNSEQFLKNLKNIGSSIVDLVVKAFTVDYENQKGERISILKEVSKLVAEMAITYAALMLLNKKLMEYGAAIGASNFAGKGDCDCGIVTPDAEKKGPRKGPSTDKIEKARNTKATAFERVKFWLQNKTAQLKKFFELLRYRPGLLGKAANIVAKIAYRVGVKASESAVVKAASSMLGNILAYASGLVTGGAGSVLGVLWTIVNLVMWGGLIYEIFEIIMENFDEINTELEKEIKKEENKDTSTKPMQNAAMLSAAVHPEPASEEAPTRKIDDYKSKKQTTAPVPAKEESKTPTPMPSAAGGVTASASPEATKVIQQNSKQGDVSFKEHEPGTDILAQNLVRLVPGFNKFTAFDDEFHNKQHPGSKHNKGLAIDFTVDGNASDYAKAASSVTKHLLDTGLNYSDFFVKDEMNARDKHTTGPHIHVQFQSADAAEKYRSKYPDVALSAYSKGASEGRSTESPRMIAASHTPIEDGKKESLAGLMMKNLSNDLAMLDKMTGGKLNLASDDMKKMMRDLEDEMHKGASFFDLSTTVVSNIREHKKSADIDNSTNQDILKTILSRQYA